MNLFNTTSKRKLITVFLIGFSLFLLFIFYFNFVIPVKAETVSVTNVAYLTTEELLNPSSQMRLRIPKINIDAVVENMGVTTNGAMDVPKGPTNAGWFTLGPRPGEMGSSVMDGHSGWKNNIPAVFDNLYKLHKGDKIYVEDERGIVTTFVVRELRKYNSKADATSVFISNDGKSHLNLITCSGIWNRVSKSSSERLVVFTDKE